MEEDCSHCQTDRARGCGDGLAGSEYSDLPSNLLLIPALAGDDQSHRLDSQM